MSDAGLKVMFRSAKNEQVVATLVFEQGRPYAVLYQYARKNSTEVIGQEKIELDPSFLEKINQALGADYLYKREPAMPEPENN